MRISLPSVTAIALAAIAWLGLGTPAYAQPDLYAGGSLSFLTQAQSAAPERFGGTTWAGSVVFGGRLTSKLRIEVEPSFGGEIFAQEYTYRPSPSLTARVVAKGRDTFLMLQVRGRVGIIEPIGGIGYVRTRTNRHATFVPGERTYFENDWTDHALAVATGVDAAIRLGPSFDVVPTFRLFIVSRPARSRFEPAVDGGTFVLRGGAGVRVRF